MALPLIAPLQALPAHTWRAFAKRLANIGLTTDIARPIVAAVEPLPPQLRKPARAWHLRNTHGPAATAMRMLMFQDPVSRSDAREAIGDLFDTLLQAGFLEQCSNDTIVSPFVLALVDDLYILSDELSRGGDAVMGFGETTIALCVAALPHRILQHVLDLGCGSGTCALVLAHRAARVVATDINPRAIALSKINAAINGIPNVDFRLGCLFEPVKNDTFDLIVSQPPFVPRPAKAEGATFLYGGARGDELALDVCSGVANHLTKSGRAIFIVEWPIYGNQTPEARVRHALGEAAIDILLLQTPGMTLDEHATYYAASIHPRLDEAFESDVIERRQHLESLGIRRLHMTFTILERAGQPTPSTESIVVEPIHKIRVSNERIDKLIAARKLLAQRDQLLTCTLRVPSKTIFAQEQDEPGAEVESTLWAKFNPDALRPRTSMTLTMLGLLTAIHEAPTVQQGLQQYADAYETPLEQALEHLLHMVDEAVRHGLLEVVTSESQ